MTAAIAGLPYEKPKLSMVAQVSTEDLAERLERALAESQKVINSQRRMQVIEASPEAGEAAQVEPSPDHSGPFAQNSKHRWRRF